MPAVRGHHLGHRHGQPAPGRARGRARRRPAARAHRRPPARAARHRRQPDHRPGEALRLRGPALRRDPGARVRDPVRPRAGATSRPGRSRPRVAPVRRDRARCTSTSRSASRWSRRATGLAGAAGRRHRPGRAGAGRRSPSRRGSSRARERWCSPATARDRPRCGWRSTPPGRCWPSRPPGPARCRRSGRTGCCWTTRGSAPPCERVVVLGRPTLSRPVTRLLAPGRPRGRGRRAAAGLAGRRPAGGPGGAGGGRQGAPRTRTPGGSLAGRPATPPPRALDRRARRGGRGRQAARAAGGP